MADLPSQIVAHGLTVDLGGRRILHDVSLDVPRGGMVALLGANGAGKTTVFRALLGLVAHSAGTVLVDGVDIGSVRRAELRRLRSRVGFVPQRLGVVGAMSALGNVLIGSLGRCGTRAALPIVAKRSLREDAMEALGRVGMADRAGQALATMSGGQQQRVALARMLLQKPSVVLADEPIASLDPAAASSVMALLRRLADEDELAVLVTLHQLQHVADSVDRVIGLRDGRVVFDGESAAFNHQQATDLYAVAG